MTGYFGVRFRSKWVLVTPLLALLCMLTGGAAAESAADFYLCPNNLFTNQMDKAQAKRLGCTRMAPGRVTQGGVNQDLEPAAPGLGSALPLMPLATPTLAVAAAQGSPAGSQPAAAPAASLPPVPAAYLPPAATARPAAAAIAPPDVSNPRTASASQRARDQDAQAILRAELATTQAALQALQRAGGPAQSAALVRLRDDEAALRRELNRLNP